MKVKLKGVNKTTKRLKSGERVSYYYAWKGGPRLSGEPGSAEFVESYQQAQAKRTTPKSHTLLALLDKYQQSPKWQSLAERTRKDCIKHILKIETEFGDFPLDALADRRTRGLFLDWRDKMGLKSARQADYTFATLATVLAWAYDRGLIDRNPCTNPGKLYKSKRSEITWTEVDEAAFMKRAPEHLKLAFMMAIWTGQRQGDLLRLTWAAYDGSHIRLKQSKTGRRVVIPVASPLRAELDKEARSKRAITILTTLKGTSWTSHGFGASWRKAIAAAKLQGLTFHDLRGTAVTRLAIAGCEITEIATITGHSLKDVATILDTHYLSRDARLAESAIEKLEKHKAKTKTPN